MVKLLALGMSGLLSLGLVGFLQGPPPPDGPPPPPKEKAKGKDPAKKKAQGPAGDLRRAYDLLRKLRSDNESAGRSDERLRDWTERAAKFYRDGIKAFDAGDRRLAHEYGVIAHDLARATDHARNAAKLDRPVPESDLPPPPDGPGPDDSTRPVRDELHHIHNRVADLREDQPEPSATFYIDAARDLYNAALRDAEAGRSERAAELSHAAEAMTHVPEHLNHIAKGPDELERDRPRPPQPKAKGDRPAPPRGDRPAPPKGERPNADALPPPLP
ncbi:MAG: hypothetical protein ABI353_22560 [Isosphaeraceae bacterium]